MYGHSKIRAIACSLATWCVLLSPVTGNNGFALDTASCSPGAIEFLTYEMKRSVAISKNTAAYLNLDPLRGPDSLVMDPINAVFSPFAWPTTSVTVGLITAVFTGGEVSHRLDDPNTPRQHIPGIASYSQPMQNFNANDNSAYNPADAQGNLVLVPATVVVQRLELHTLMLDSSYSVTTLVWGRQT